MAKRKESEQTKFERWLSDWEGYADRQDIRENRIDSGYDNPEWDTAWAAWCARAALNGSDV